MARIDTNGDGAIDAEEYARVDETGGFSGLDLDGDGRIRVGELETWLRVTQPRPDAPFPPATAWLTGGSTGPRAVAPGRPPSAAPPRAVTTPTGAVTTPTGAVTTPTGAVTTPASSGIPPMVVGVGILVAGLVAGALLGRRRRRRR